jgi:hypothetical protein
MDDDLLVEATRRQILDVPFSGVVYAHQLRISIGQAVHDLALMAEVLSDEDLRNRLEFLPL